MVIFGSCSKPLGPLETANALFARLAREQLKQAYDMGAFSFQVGESFASFQATAKDVGLVGGTGVVSWTRTKVTDNEAKLEGKVGGHGGTDVRVTLTLVRERGQWCLFALNTPDNGSGALFSGNRFTLVGNGAAFNNVASRPPPTDQACRQLVEESLVSFNDAVQRHTFADFYRSISYSWQRQVTLHQLQTAFQPFIDDAINLGPLRALTSVFDEPPHVNSEGVLILNGHYPPQPYKVYFALRYTYEMPAWKLLGIDVKLLK